MLPVKSDKPRKWIAGPGGEIVPYVPPPKPVHLTTMQQHTAMRLALAHTLRLLTEHGFRTNCIEQSSCAISLSFKGMNFDMSIREPSRIAYVTSSPYDSGQRRKIGEDRLGNPLFDMGPGVRLASDEIKGQYVVQVIGSKISSLMPLYIECPENEPDPVGYVLKNILMLVASIMKDQKLIDQASTDTTTMKRGELPDFLKTELGDAFKLLEDIPGAV
jgi:hypothetical protein